MTRRVVIRDASHDVRVVVDVDDVATRHARVQRVAHHVDRRARARFNVCDVARRVVRARRRVASHVRRVRVVATRDDVVANVIVLIVIVHDRVRNAIRVHDSRRITQRSQMTTRDFCRCLHRIRDRSHVDRVVRVDRVQRDNAIENVVARNDDVHVRSFRSLQRLFVVNAFIVHVDTSKTRRSTSFICIQSSIYHSTLNDNH